MDSTTNRRRRWLWRLLAFGIWTFLGVFAASQLYVVVHSASKIKSDVGQVSPNITFLEILRLSMVEVYLWGILALPILWLGRLFPLDQRRWPTGLAVHLPASFGFAMVESVLMVLISEVIRQEVPKPTISLNVLQFYFLVKLHANIFYYWVILSVGQFLNYYRKYRAQELQAVQLQARLAEAQLQVLKMQLHPHFLFNTLHAISALIHQDVELADRMIARLGDLLRNTLENVNKQEVSVKEEIDFIQPYLEIEQARLGSRLQVKLNIAADTMDAQVPNLILQPLVENAVRHGVAPRTEVGHVEVRAWREDSLLLLQVRDDGPGLPAKQEEPSREGLGLANTKARIEQLYGGAGKLQLSNGQGRGLTVTVTIPFREANGHSNQPARETNHENSNLDR